MARRPLPLAASLFREPTPVTTRFPAKPAVPALPPPPLAPRLLSSRLPRLEPAPQLSTSPTRERVARRRLRFREPARAPQQAPPLPLRRTLAGYRLRLGREALQRQPP